MPTKEMSVDLAVLEKIVLLQALPTMTAKMGQCFNLKQNKYYSMQQDHFGKKLGTGRVVSTCEIGIDLSYTVECSFWQYVVK